MKKARFLALFLALILCFSALPFTYAKGEADVSVVTTSNDVFFGNNYFVVDLNIFDKYGKSVGVIPSASDGGKSDLITEIGYIGESFVFVTEYNEEYTKVNYFLYSIDNGAITETYRTSMYGKNGDSYIIPNFSPDGDYFTFNEISDSFVPVGYVLFDAYGRLIFSESGKVAEPLGKGCVATSSADGTCEIVCNVEGNATRIALDELVYECTLKGDIIVMNDDDGMMGIRNNRGDIVIPTANEDILEYADYYVAKNGLIDDDWRYETSAVYDRFGNKVAHIRGDVTDICGDFCVVINKDDTYSLINLNAPSTVIAKGDDYCIWNNYVSIGYYDTAATLYDTNGKVIAGDLYGVYDFSCDDLTGDIIYTNTEAEMILISDGKTTKLDADYDYAYFIVSGYLLCGDYDSDTEWVEKDGKRITSPFYTLYDYWCYDGCDVFVMTDENYENYSVYIAKDKASLAFSDVADGYWAAGDILTAYRNGLMNGTGGGLFSPTGTVTRAQVVTILWRLAGCPDPKKSDDYTTYDPYFSDVKESAWYYHASEWAGSYGIVNGVGSNPDVPMFGGDRPITRAEVVALFARFAEYEGWYIELGADIVGFADVDSVPAWATAYIGWGVETGLITGKGIDGKAYLAPNDNLTRAELAAVANRYN